MPKSLSIKPLLILLVWLACFTACSPNSPEAILADYIARLSRSLDTPIPAAHAPSLAPPPRAAQLRIDLPTGSIDGLDFLSLRGCALQATIGKRNSALGRHARPSQRLLLELEFLGLAPDCITQLHARGKRELAETLATAQRQKRAQLPALIFNATLGSEEYRQFWQLKGVAANYPEQTSSKVVSALEYINAASSRWLSGDYQFDNHQFEIRLSEVAAGDAGILMQALHQQAIGLQQGDALLHSRLENGPLCSGTHRSEQANIAITVMHKYFIGQVQPVAANYHRRYQQLSPPIQDLEQLLQETLPANYLTWASQRDNRLAMLTAAPKQHAQRLQHLLGPCMSNA